MCAKHTYVMKQMYVKIYTVALYTEQAMIHND